MKQGYLILSGSAPGCETISARALRPMAVMFHGPGGTHHCGAAGGQLCSFLHLTSWAIDICFFFPGIVEFSIVYNPVPQIVNMLGPGGAHDSRGAGRGTLMFLCLTAQKMEVCFDVSQLCGIDTIL